MSTHNLKISSWLGLFKSLSFKKVLLMFLPKRMEFMLDSTTIELHLIHNCLCIADNAVRILTIETVKFLRKGELPEFESIKYDIFPPLNKGYLHDTKVNILKLPEKYIHYHKWDNRGIAGNTSKKSNYRIDIDYLDISAWDDKVFHKHEYKKIAQKCYFKI